MTTSTTPETQLPLAADHWALDTNHSTVGFAIRHLGVSKVRGHFRSFDVTLDVGDTLTDSSLTATIDVASLDTGNADRDAHVLSADIIDVANRPTMTFRSTSISGGGAEYEVLGDLTIGGVTRAVRLDVELGGANPFADGRIHAGFEARAEIRRSDFGIDVALPPGVSSAMLGDVVKIELDVQLLEPGD